MNEPNPPELGKHGRILEGIVTTANEDGTVNVAPMGLTVAEDLRILVLRPYRTSATFRNLQRTRQGVLHVTDDVLLFARAAIGRLQPIPRLASDHPLVLADTCRWFEFKIVSSDTSEERALLTAQTTDHGTLREFFGFNRAKHAVIEAAILASRVHLLAPVAIQQELRRLQILVDKTGAASEHEAFQLLWDYVLEASAVAATGEDSTA